jgi:D-alanine-D-alanine ligase
MDKAYSKIVFEKEGIPQGKYLVFTRKQIERDMVIFMQELKKRCRTLAL